MNNNTLNFDVEMTNLMASFWSAIKSFGRFIVLALGAAVFVYFFHLSIDLLLYIIRVTRPFATMDHTLVAVPILSAVACWVAGEMYPGSIGRCRLCKTSAVLLFVAAFRIIWPLMAPGGPLAR